MKSNDSSLDYRGSKLLIAISLTSLAGYLLFKLSVYPFVQLPFETIFLLTFLVGVLFRPWQFKFDFAISLLLIGLLLPVIFFAINSLSNSALASQFFLYEKLPKIMIFSAMGFWLGGKRKNIYFFLILVFFGLIVALFNVDTLNAFKEIFSGKRVSFKIHNAQHTAMFFGLAIIGFISFYKELLSFIKDKKFKIFFFFLYNFALLLSLVVFIGTQTRAALFGLDFIFIFSLIHFLLYVKKHSITRKVIYLFSIYALFSFLFLTAFTINTVNKRGIEPEVTHELLSKNLSNIPMSSLGIRINTWIEASKWIKEKPLHGWGGKVRKHVIQQSDFSDHIKKHFGHFHNSYIEFIVSYGLIGLAYIMFIYIWVNRKIYVLARENINYKGIWLFTLYGSLFLMIINISESFIFFSTGMYATAFLLAPGYSLYLSNLYSDKKHLILKKPI